MATNRQALTEQEALAERERYVSAFNNTMVNIWAEKITLLGIIDTSQLLGSVKGLVTRADGRFIEVRLSQAFLEYGIWQDYGTGRETPRGNPGDIGRAKKRKKRPWFARKYYGSVMNIRDFMADNLAQEFSGVCMEINPMNRKDFGRNHATM